MAAISKPDGSVRPLHDGTHSVMVNHSIVYQDQLQLPGPAEVAAAVREAAESLEAPFCVSADIKAASLLAAGLLLMEAAGLFKTAGFFHFPSNEALGISDSIVSSPKDAMANPFTQEPLSLLPLCHAKTCRPPFCNCPPKC